MLSIPFSIYQTNHTTYTIENLEPNTGYKFRVIALNHNRSSTFSNWSSAINTTGKYEMPSSGLFLLIAQKSAVYAWSKMFFIFTIYLSYTD